MSGQASRSLVGKYDNKTRANKGNTLLLVYRVEAIIPTEVRSPTLKTNLGRSIYNNEALKVSVDMTEELPGKVKV